MRIHGSAMLVLLVLLTCVGCAGSSGEMDSYSPFPAGPVTPIAVISQKELEVYKAVLRDVLSREEENGRTLFISLGPESVDPSSEMLEDLGDLHLDLKPLSVALKPEPSGRRHFIDPKSHEPGVSCSVEIVQWKSGDRVEIRYARYFSPLASSSTELIYGLHDGNWLGFRK